MPVTSVLEIVELDQIEDLGLDLFGCVGGIVNREKIVPVFDSVTLGLKNDLKTKLDYQNLKNKLEGTIDLSKPNIIPDTIESLLI